MAANTNPIFVRKPNIGFARDVLTANTAKDAASGTVYTVFTADATEGSFLDRLLIMPKGTNVQTVMRVFLNNGGATTTAANNALIRNIQLSATTNSEIVSIVQTEVPMRIPLPAGWRVLVTIGTGVAAGFDVTGVGGDY